MGQERPCGVGKLGSQWGWCPPSCRDGPEGTTELKALQNTSPARIRSGVLIAGRHSGTAVVPSSTAVFWSGGWQRGLLAQPWPNLLSPKALEKPGCVVPTTSGTPEQGQG